MAEPVRLIHFLLEIMNILGIYNMKHGTILFLAGRIVG